MSLALWCVLVAALLPLFATVIAKTSGSRASGKRFDNAHPRAWQQALTGLPARAHGAHLNGFEAFPLFAVAVLVAEIKAAPQGIVNTLALLFILVRVIYIALYLIDQDRLRSLAWSIGLVLSIAIFTSPSWAK